MSSPEQRQMHEQRAFKVGDLVMCRQYKTNIYGRVTAANGDELDVEGGYLMDTDWSQCRDDVDRCTSPVRQSMSVKAAWAKYTRLIKPVEEKQ